MAEGIERFKNHRKLRLGRLRMAGDANKVW
jgi:hypothetical protein